MRAEAVEKKRKTKMRMSEVANNLQADNLQVPGATGKSPLHSSDVEVSTS